MNAVAHVQAGPHPENQLKRREARRPRHALEVLLVVVAIGSSGLVITSGAAAVSSLVAVALVIGGSQALAAALLVVRRPLGRIAAWCAAALAIAWGSAAILIADGVTWFTAAVLAIGAFEIMLVAGSTPRKRDRDSDFR